VESKSELAALVHQMRAHFLVPPSTDGVLAEFDAATALLRPEHQAVAKALSYSLASVLSTVAMPFALASASAHQRVFQSFHAAERIRDRFLNEETPSPDEDLECFRERVAYTKADTRMHEFTQSPDGEDVITRHISEFLVAGMEQGLESAAQELLQQGLVLVWSAFEVFCRDAFETLLN
jgi:hypothetical protein